jgi:hypothetical protein
MPARPAVRPARLAALVTAGGVLAGLAFGAAPAIAAQADVPPLIVSEILPDTVSFDEYEFLEVHNTTDAAIDLDAAGYGFAYIYSDDDERPNDVPLTVPAGTVVDAGETVVLWLSYQATNVDSFARSVDDFKAHFASTQPDLDYDVVRVEGQAGMANGGGRGIAITDAGGDVSRSFYPTGSPAVGAGVTFRLPGDPAQTSLAVLGQRQPATPGVLDPETLVREPVEEPQPSTLAARDLLFTEVHPNNTGADKYEFFELVNTTDRDLDLTAAGVEIRYEYGANSTVLTYPAGTVIRAGATAVFWDTYSPNTDGLDADDFRAFYAASQGATDYQVIPFTGQAGLHNTAARTFRVLAGDTVVTAATYQPAQIGDGLSAHFRLPTRSDDAWMTLLTGPAAPTPGAVDAEAFVPAPFVPQPDPSLVTAALQITEVTPDTVNVGASDGYEFVEVYNASTAPVDFADYSLNYLYPLADLTNSSTALWPSTPREAVIEPGKTLVFWIKNGANDALTDADFNTKWGTDLVGGENLVEVFSGGMANGSARGLEIVTNTGFPLNRAYYNLGGVDDVDADLGIQYAPNPADLMVQQKLGKQAATPGSVFVDQVPSGLMVVPADTVAPAIVDTTVAEIDPAAEFAFAFDVTDDVQARTVRLEYRSDVDDAVRTLDLQAAADGRSYGFSIPAVDLTGKSWFEYRVIARDGTNEAGTDLRRLPVTGVNTDPLRVNLTDGQFVTGTTPVSAAADVFPPVTTIEIDGAAVPTTPQVESDPMFAFEATAVDTFFKNGVRMGDDVLRIFDDGIYEGWETIATPVPLDRVLSGEPLTVSVWAGTKAAPEIDLNENNDDFTIKNVRLVLPDGRTLVPAGYDDPSRILNMGDSAGKLDFYDAVFTVPGDAFTAVGHAWDTTTTADGQHVVRAAAGDASVARSVLVDNTAPAITTDVEEGKRYQGEFSLDADATDAGSGMDVVAATLDGRTIELPYATSSIELTDGEHEFTIVARDLIGNEATRTVRFTTPVEEPGNELITPLDGETVEEGDVELRARAVDPTEDRLDVAFKEGYRLTAGDGVTAYSGETAEADGLDREGRRLLTAEEVAAIGRFDEQTAAVASTGAFPYQLFEVTVPADAGADADVRVRWDGQANADAKVLMYVLADGVWEEVDRALTTGGAPTAFTLEATVPVEGHATEGVVTVLVQHSEGFAGADRSTRDTPVTPRNAGDTPRSAYDFTLAWESDTQYYNATYYDRQLDIHNYLLEERDDLNLQYMFHTGDIVDNAEDFAQWANADPAYRMLDEAGLPYGVLAGNHDVGHKDGNYTNYSTYFGASRFAGNPWYGGDYLDNRGHYDLITAGGIDFIVVSMGWDPGDPEIAWMNEVLAQYPERVAIVNLHEYMLTTGGLGPIPQRIYDEVVATNANVKMVMSGHYHDAYTRIDGFDDDGDGTAERQVYQMLFDYQGLPEGGQAFLRLLHFDNQTGQIGVRTYSPYLDQYNSEDPTLDLEHQEFTIPYAAIGIASKEKTLATDAFEADVLTSKVIEAFDDVESGTELAATWTPAVGTHDWYVDSVDPYGATAVSELRRLLVEAKGEEPGGEEPGGEQPGGEEPGTPGDGSPAGPSIPVPVDELDPAAEGGISGPATARIGDPITLQVGAERAGEWVQVWLHSTPTALGGWTKVAADGTVRAVIPASVQPGTHTLVVQDAANGVIGWITLEVLPAATDAGLGDPVGSAPAASGPRSGLADTGAEVLPGLLLAGLVLAAGGLLLASRLAQRRRPTPVD